MAPTTNYEKAIEERSLITENITFLNSKISSNSTTALTEDEVDRLLHRASVVEESVLSNYSALTHSAPKGTDMEPHKSLYQSMLDQAIRAHASLHGIKRGFPVTSSATPQPTSQQKIKLPPLELPKFSGNLQEWVPFRDLYITAVHNSALTKVEKLTQLKTLLTGEAARQVRSLILSEANYDIAWTSLQERYENNRELLFTIMRRLFNQNQVQPNSASAIRNLIDTTKECVRSLEVLQIPTQHWDAVITFLLFSKMDSASRELWEQSLTDTTIPKLNRLYEFLEQRARALTASATGSHQARNKTTDKRIQSHHTTTGKCKLGCDYNHPFYKCPAFRKFSPHERKEALTKFKNCHNCLMFGHNAADCNSQYTCKRCNEKHHTMIHVDNQGHSSQQPQASRSDSQRNVTSNFTQSSNNEIQTAPLATARVLIPNSNGKDVSFRAFIDPGSSVDIVTERLVQKLNLPLFESYTSITGLEENPVSSSKNTTRLTIKPHFTSDVTYTITALVVKKICGRIPSDKYDSNSIYHLSGLSLADPNFNQPSTIDIMIGSSIFWDSLLDGRVRGGSGEPVATNSKFGWLVAGKSWPTLHRTVTSFITNIELDKSLRRFWETEELSQQQVMTHEEQQCEKHFADTHTRDLNGRFSVCIPWKTPRPEIGESRTQALKRFLSLERKYTPQGNFKSLKLNKFDNHVDQQSKWNTYKEFMFEYEQLGHMSLAPPEEVTTPVNKLIIFLTTAWRNLLALQPNYASYLTLLQLPPQEYL